MKEYLSSLTGFELPNDFTDLFEKFVKHFGSQDAAMTKMGEYIGFDFAVNFHVIRGYECVPFEAQLPFQTGSNGENMGWLNIAPELPNFKKPFITWAPLGCLVIYHGNSMNQVLAGKINYLHEHDDYESVDLDFLKSININPMLAKSIEHFVNYEDDKLNPIPFQIPRDWRYEATKDGVGIYAKLDHYSPEQSLFSQISNTENAIKEIKKLNNDCYYASAVWLIKNSISKSYFTEEPFDYILEMYDLAIESYDGLGRNEISKIINDKYKPSR